MIEVSNEGSTMMNKYATLDTSIYDNPRSWNMTNDLIFKVIFGRDTIASKLLLVDLVNTVLDIKAKTDSGIFINIEMQVDRQNDYFERALYYWAQLYTEQLKEGYIYVG